MNIIPFGIVRDERIEISKRYKLIEYVNGVWRLTEKCKNNYDSISYFKYLQGKVEIPTRVSKSHSKAVESKNRVVTPIKKQKPLKSDPNEFKSPECQKIIDEILSM